ncbi:hypothetical protein J2W24_006340 [Variovorax boronicumulans]|uniref:hypothetical protein n=1 Tax=Variovorax boronicumulans TaxID=436515 RepID=UPI002780D876|nr:hypothetical protein [Variovorax boronicumulans]MDP9920658.1 hypothetical protein [Variovorax boronicumulans]
MKFPFLLPLALMALLSMAGCATTPKDAASVVESYRRFLVDTETPFPERTRRLGLELEGDMASLTHRFARLKPSPGSAINFASVSALYGSPPHYRTKMLAEFDTSVVCITRDDLAALGKVGENPGDIMVMHEIRDGRMTLMPTRVGPGYLFLTTAPESTVVRLAFAQACLHRMEHEVRLTLRR